MTQAEEFAAAARSFVGVPFAVHGRDPVSGLDCAGLVIASLRQIGIEMPDSEYLVSATADYDRLLTEHLSQVFRKGERPLQVGDLLVLRYPPVFNHLAIYLGNSLLIHAWDHGRAKAKSGAITGRQVTLMTIDHSLDARVSAIWRLG